MKIISPHNQYGWITCSIDDRWVQAKVYDTPSEFGVNHGRVSKLSIGKPHNMITQDGEAFFNKIDYNYDRGLDFDNLPEGVLDNIIEKLESLPTGAV